MPLLGLLLAGLTGIVLGLLGGGGSILTVPIFTYVLGFEAKSAIAMSLPVVGGTSLVGAYRHWRLGNVHLRTAATFGAFAMLGSYLGARVAAFVPGEVQLTMLATVMLAAAVSMLRSARVSATAGDREDGTPARERPASLPLLGFVGFGVGVLTGLVGIGGGFLLVPALAIIGQVPIRQSIGTSLLVIAMNSAAGLAGYLGQVTIAWRVVAMFTAVAALGAVAGTRLGRHVSPVALKRTFGAILLVLGALILIENRDVFLGSLRARPPNAQVRLL